MRRMVNILDMAEAINRMCEKKEYFWACGLIKETIGLWRYETAVALLCEEARMLAEHYKPRKNENC